jgi:hypothetical protein
MQIVPVLFSVWGLAPKVPIIAKRQVPPKHTGTGTGTDVSTPLFFGESFFRARGRARDSARSATRFQLEADGWPDSLFR